MAAKIHTIIAIRLLGKFINDVNGKIEDHERSELVLLAQSQLNVLKRVRHRESDDIINKRIDHICEEDKDANQAFLARLALHIEDEGISYMILTVTDDKVLIKDMYEVMDEHVINGAIGDSKTVINDDEEESEHGQDNENDCGFLDAAQKTMFF